MFLSADEFEIVLLSLKVSGVAVLLTLPIAFGLAYALARAQFRGRLLLDGLVHLPLVLPPVVIGWVLLLAFGHHGLIGSPLDRWFGISVLFRWTGAAIASAIMALPLMVRSMRLSIEMVDRRLEGAARTLGAGPWRTFSAVTLPLSFPGILAALVIGFARSIGEFGATITFVSNIPGETRTLPLAIYGALQIPGAENTVYRLAAVSIALSFGALVASEWIIRRRAAHQSAHVL